MPASPLFFRRDTFLLNDELPSGSFVSVWATVDHKLVDAILFRILLVVNNLQLHASTLGAGFEMLERNMRYSFQR